VNWRATSRRLLPYALVAAGGFLLAYLFVAFVIFPPQIVPDDAKVPQVVGLLFDEAVTRLEAVGRVAGRIADDLGSLLGEILSDADVTYIPAPPKQYVEPASAMNSLVVKMMNPVQRFPVSTAVRAFADEVESTRLDCALAEAATRPHVRIEARMVLSFMTFSR